MRVILPEGTLYSCVNSVQPVVEKAVEMNGKNKRILEVAKSMDMNPTAIFFNLGAESYLIGNLPTSQVRDILSKLCSNDNYDLSALDYQKVKKVSELTIDDGKTKPYWQKGNIFNNNNFGMNNGYYGMGNQPNNALNVFDTDDLYDDEDYDPFDDDAVGAFD